MSSTECLRDLISERLTAAAEEIFRAFQTTVIKYEEEIDRQSRLLELVLKPGTRFHTTGPQHQHVCKEKEVPLDQERNPSLDQDGPESPQIKEEQEELCISLDQDDPDPPHIKEEQEGFYMSLEGEQLVLKQEAETFTLTPTCEESDISVDQSLDSGPVESAAEIEHVVTMSVKGRVGPSANREEQLCHGSHGAESRDHKDSKRPRPYENPTDNKDDSTTFKIHIDTSTGKECFVCDTCGKSFQYKSKWNTHIRVHTGEKPYNCKTCGKGFSLMENLKKHMRIHTGEKPYQCATCERRFSELGSLKAHMKTHAGTSKSRKKCLSPVWSSAAANETDPPKVLYDFNHRVNTGPAMATSSNPSLPQVDGLWTFLHNRRIPEENILKMQQDHIDSSVVGEVDGTTMADYIPAYGDRIAARRFSVEKRRRGRNDSKRPSLVEKLRRKMGSRSSKDKDFDNEHSMRPTKLHLRNNKRALKMTRKIELGWIHDKKQVRKRSGGGTGVLDISKNATKIDILAHAKRLFFPNEKSGKGQWGEFSHDIVDFQEAYLDEGVSVGELYETHKMGVLRFYLFTESLTSEYDDDDDDVEDEFTEMEEGGDEQQYAELSYEQPIMQDCEQQTHTLEVKYYC